MEIFNTQISPQVYKYLKDTLDLFFSSKDANQELYKAFGLISFFENEDDFRILKSNLSSDQSTSLRTDKIEYGDFQTNEELACNVISKLQSKEISPKLIIEPTCGKGHFIIQSLKKFSDIKEIFGIEIYKPYVWECKFSIISFYLNNYREEKPDISILHRNVFEFDFKNIFKKYSDRDVLILGNPPWVTNSKLGELKSTNLPKKTNFKNLNGLDAITGKGNFDIAEFITLMLIETFQNHKGNIALLVKNSVIKNIVYNQFDRKLNISKIEKFCINSKKEFNVSVEASLFYCQLNIYPEFKCREYDFYDSAIPKLEFGWLNNKFVSNIEHYSSVEQIDGKCCYEWRQGVKHDCSSIMEFDKIDDYFINGLGEKFILENELVYGLLKSSDLKNSSIGEPRKYTIITQKKVGQDTTFIKHQFPETFKYLDSHSAIFNTRKSSIYKNKPLFSIFGIGDYSFKKYKIAISGLYKTFHFTLVLPNKDKPIMLDDTCYLIGFDKIEFAVYSLLLLNSEITMQFLKSITFPDAKRTFTKDVLMRIDLLKLSKMIKVSSLEKRLIDINRKYNLDISLDNWNDFIHEIAPLENMQTELFTF